jgi:hypothetical protein
MSPWLLLVVFAATLNLLIFVFVRGRWDAFVGVLAAASLIGAVAGHVVGARTGFDLLRVGDFHLAASSVGAQLAMVVAALLAALGPSRREEDG